MKTITATHELDKLFDLVPGQTQMEVPGTDIAEIDTDTVDGELVPYDVSPAETAVDSYDRKDNEIEDQLSDIQTKAIEAYETMIVAAQSVVDKSSTARTAEVAAAFLQIALNAAKEKNSTKDRKDKIVAAKRGNSGAAPAAAPQSITNNIVTDRETAMRLLRESRDGA